MLYLRFDEHSVTWRNSLGRTYTAPYTSIDRLTYLDNNRNGWIRIIFRDQGKRKRLSFDPGQFDGTVIFGHILYKVRTGEWASSVQQLSESGFLEGRNRLRRYERSDSCATCKPQHLIPRNPQVHQQNL